MHSWARPQSRPRKDFGNTGVHQRNRCASPGTYTRRPLGPVDTLSPGFDLPRGMPDQDHRPITRFEAPRLAGTRQEQSGTLTDSHLLSCLAEMNLRWGQAPQVDMVVHNTCNRILDELQESSDQRKRDMQRLLNLGLLKKPRPASRSSVGRQRVDIADVLQDRQQSAFSLNQSQMQAILAHPTALASSMGRGAQMQVGGEGFADPGPSQSEFNSIDFQSDGTGLIDARDRPMFNSIDFQSDDTGLIDASPGQRSFQEGPPCNVLEAAALHQGLPEDDGGRSTKKLVNQAIRKILSNRRGGNKHNADPSHSSQIWGGEAGVAGGQDDSEDSKASMVANGSVGSSLEGNSPKQFMPSQFDSDSAGRTNYVIKNTFVEPVDDPKKLECPSKYFTEEPRIRSQPASMGQLPSMEQVSPGDLPIFQGYSDQEIRVYSNDELPCVLKATCAMKALSQGDLPIVKVLSTDDLPIVKALSLGSLPEMRFHTSQGDLPPMDMHAEEYSEEEEELAEPLSPGLVSGPPLSLHHGAFSAQPLGMAMFQE